jgi:threonine/homoserine/homoserine lactone efflux protein
MTSAELTALLLLCTAMSFTPGPNNNLSTVLAVNFGLKRADAEHGGRRLRWFNRSMAAVLGATAAWMTLL